MRNQFLKNKKANVPSLSAFLRNRKGEGVGLMSEKVVKILIALVCIVFLVGLIGTIWYNVTKDSDLSKAQSSLMLISSEILRLEGIGMENPDGIPILNPSGWEILSFTENNKPNVCVNENCICICDVAWNDNAESQANKCDENGICKVVPNLIKFNKIGISSTGIFLSIKKTEAGIEIHA